MKMILKGEELTFLDGVDLGARAASSIDGFLVLLSGGGRSFLPDDHRFPVLRNWPNSRHSSLQRSLSLSDLLWFLKQAYLRMIIKIEMCLGCTLGPFINGCRKSFHSIVFPFLNVGSGPLLDVFDPISQFGIGFPGMTVRTSYFW